MVGRVFALLMGLLAIIILPSKAVQLKSVAFSSHASHRHRALNGDHSERSSASRHSQGQCDKLRDPLSIDSYTSGSKATEKEIKELLSQAAHELEPWKDGITLEMVESVYCNDAAMDTFRLQVVGGRPYLVGPGTYFQSRFFTIQRQILDLAERYNLPDVDIIMTSSDLCPELDAQPRPDHVNATKCSKKAPIFSQCRHKYHSTCVAMPDFAFGGWPEAFMPEWQSARPWLLLAAKHNPFDQRDPTLFWRGGMTNSQRGIMRDSIHVRESPVTDVDLVDWGNHDIFMREFISLPEHCKHKQLLHLPGNSFSARLRMIMLCGSPIVFPYDDDWEPKEFWYHMLRDRHNIMLTEKVHEGNDGRNVVSIAEELAANSTLAEEIGKNGQYLVSEILHPDNVMRYWLELFIQYNKIMTFKPQVHKDAVPLEIALMRPSHSYETRDRTCEVC